MCVCVYNIINIINSAECAVTNEQSLYTLYMFDIIYDFSSAAEGTVMIYLTYEYKFIYMYNGSRGMVTTVAGSFSSVKVYSLGLQVYVVYNREVVST